MWAVWLVGVRGGELENIIQAARKPEIVAKRGRNLKRGGRVG